MQPASLPERWLILADDLTGAADCAIAFARRGLAATVSWNAEAPGGEVHAFDTGSRAMTAAAAAAQHGAFLAACHGPGVRLFKKIDSTLRGQPAVELAETMRVLRQRGHGALAVVAPAFPATCRTTHGGRIRLHGQALEDTALWAREHSYPSADLVAVLGAAGLRVRLAGLEAVRAGPEALARLLREALGAGVDAVVCDAVAAADLDIVAQATLPLAEHLFWTGSGGLAQALANAGAGKLADPEPIRVVGGILFVVGSIAEASRAASAVLAADGTVLPVAVTPAVLRGERDSPAWLFASRQIAATLRAGRDVLVEVAADNDSASVADLSQGAALARHLAELVRPAAAHIGALFATGGETALALLNALGVSGIRMVEEIEPGVPLGLTRGTLAVPVVTKAGAFGDAETLRRCLSHLRRLRRTEMPS